MTELKGYLRDFRLHVPKVTSACPGIGIFGRTIRSVLFSPDVCIMRTRLLRFLRLPRSR